MPDKKVEKLSKELKKAINGHTYDLLTANEGQIEINTELKYVSCKKIKDVFNVISEFCEKHGKLNGFMVFIVKGSKENRTFEIRFRKGKVILIQILVNVIRNYYKVFDEPTISKVVSVYNGRF